MAREEPVPHGRHITGRGLGSRDHGAGSLFLVENIRGDIDPLAVCLPVNDHGHGEHMDPVRSLL